VNKPKPLHLAIAQILFFSVAGTTIASAQTPDAEHDAQTLDTLTVTGSRISIPGVEASSPVSSVERQEFLSTQPVAVESFLKEIPAITASFGQATNWAASGAATINMRGLGDNRTLVLIDGRRPVPFNLDNVVDTNTIPMTLLQSVDILTGGASVVYGADAVSGVANFILRRDFEGVEINVNAGQSGHNDGNRQNYEITFGALSDDGRANAVLSVGYTNTDPVSQSARRWARDPLNSFTGGLGGSLTTIPATVNFPNLGDLLGLTVNTGQLNLDTGLLESVSTLYNSSAAYYQTALERWQTTALARYEFNEHAETYGQVNYTRSKVAARQAPSGVFTRSAQVPIANPYIPEPMRQQICSAFGIAAGHCASGFDDNNQLIRVPLTIGRRLPELGFREDGFDTKTFQVTAGLRGVLSGDWNYDSYWSYGESEQLRSAGNTGSFSKLQQALNATSTTQCLDPSGGCVPINLFGPEGSASQDQIDFIQLTAFTIQQVEQTNAAFNLDGNLGEFKSPWADYPIGIATGVEYRRTAASIRSDASFKTESEMMGHNNVPDSSGGFTFKEAYLESIVPLVSGYRGVQNLSLELGYRHSDFSNSGGFGDSYGSWKYGLTWTPVDALKLRAMRQRATRAPNINELFAPDRTGTTGQSSDPCQGTAINQADANTKGTLSWLCVQTGVPFNMVGFVDPPSANQVGIRRRSNPALAPEEADTTTLGFVWTPSNQVSITLDYWNIEINQAITATSVADILDGCFDPNLNPGFTFNAMCELANGRHVQSGGYNVLDARGILQPLTNAGFIQKRGYDLGVRFSHSLPGMLGRLQYAWDLSKVSKDVSQPTASSIRRDCLGYYSTSCSLSHKLRSNLRATWTVQDFSATAVWRYYGALDVEPLAEATRAYFPAFRHIPSYSYLDLGLAYNTPWNAKISLSVNNVFDKAPPIVGGGVGSDRENAGNTFPQWYDVLGRYYTLGVSFRF